MVRRVVASLLASVSTIGGAYAAERTYDFESCGDFLFADIRIEEPRR